MQEVARNLLLQTLRAKLELTRIVAASLTEKLDLPHLSVREQRHTLRHWLDVTEDGENVEFVLELLRQHDRGQRGKS
jgi:hypothetical protein